jgi:hypothetical protein
MTFQSLILAFIVFLSGCASVPDKAYRPTPTNVEGTTPPIFTIEINDRGALHDQGQLASFKDAINNKRDIQIISFIHGWHHNASLDDDNYSEFRKFIAQFSRKTNKEVLGLYVGWRGDSIKSVFDPISDLISDFWTIWGRKNASIIVGDNATKDIITVIKSSVLSNGNSAAIIGHSLGGSVLFRSVKDTLDKDAEMRSRLTYVLLNPAISSDEYNLADTSKFFVEKTKPLLITIQSNKDIAVNLAFRAAYFANPVGFNNSHITHDMWACDPSDSPCMDMLKRKLANNKCATEFNSGSWFIDARDENGQRAPTCSDAGKRIDWVIDARHTVSAYHNNILTEAEVSALSELMNGK